MEVELPPEVLDLAREEKESEQAVQQLELQEWKEKEKEEEVMALDVVVVRRKCMTLLKKIVKKRKFWNIVICD